MPSLQRIIRGGRIRSIGDIDLEITVGAAVAGYIVALAPEVVTLPTRNKQCSGSKHADEISRHTLRLHRRHGSSSPQKTLGRLCGLTVRNIKPPADDFGSEAGA